MGTVHINKPRDRYPGLRSFTKEDAELFFGRGQELLSLTRLLAVNRVNVLFGPSGVGKSSLLNTAFEKEERLKHFVPVTIRLNDTYLAKKKSEISPNLKLSCNSISKALKAKKIPYHSRNIEFDRDTPLLWEYVNLADKAIKKINPNAVLVLIFDQFEEFFINDPDERQQFCQQIAEICYESSPTRVSQWIGRIPSGDRLPEQMNWYKQPDIRVLFSIRADRLSLLNELSPLVPQILHNRFELKPFNRNNAEEAILEPAKIPNPDLRFGSPPINIHTAVVKKILDDLSNPLGEIEGTFLQIVCYYIEDRIKTLVTDIAATGSTHPDLTSPVDFGLDAYDQQIDINTILDNFYEDQIAKLQDPETILFTKKAIEELTNEGQRTNLLPRQFEPMLKHNRQLIDYLLSARLIRTEATARGLTYELSHDKLVLPVEKSKNIRLQKELLEQETLRLTEEALLKEQEIEKQRVNLEKETYLKNIAESESRKAREQALMAELAMKTAMIEEEKAREAQKTAERYRKNIFYSCIVMGILFLFTGYFLYINAVDKLNKLLDQADVYYEQNNHFFAFNIWDSYLDKMALATKKKEVSDLLATRPFYDISGGDAIKQIRENRFAVHYKDNTILLWTPKKGYKGLNYKELPDTDGQPVSTALNMLVSDNRRYIAFRSSLNGDIYVYDDDKKRTLHIPESKISISSRVSRSNGKNKNIQDYKMDFLANNNFIAFITSAGDIYIYNLKTQQPLPRKMLKGDNHTYFSVDIRNNFIVSSDEHYILTKRPASDTLSIFDISNWPKQHDSPVAERNGIDQVYLSYKGDSVIFRTRNNLLCYAPLSKDIFTDADTIQSSVVDLLLSPDHSKALLLKNYKALLVYDFSAREINKRVNGDLILKKLNTFYQQAEPRKTRKKPVRKIALYKSLSVLKSGVRWVNQSDRFTLPVKGESLVEIDISEGQSYYLFSNSQVVSSLVTSNGCNYVFSPDGTKCAFIDRHGLLQLISTKPGTGKTRLVKAAGIQVVKNIISTYMTIYNLDDILKFDDGSDRLAVISNFDSNENKLNVFDCNRESYLFVPFDATYLGNIFTKNYIQLVNGFDNDGGIMFFNNEPRGPSYYRRFYPPFKDNLKSRFSADIFSNH